MIVVSIEGVQKLVFIAGCIYCEEVKFGVPGMARSVTSTQWKNYRFPLSISDSRSGC